MLRGLTFAGGEEGKSPPILGGLFVRNRGLSPASPCTRLGCQQPERDPVKKPRDLAQARAVAQLVRESMPYLNFDEAMTSLHGDVRAMRKLLDI